MSGIMSSLSNMVNSSWNRFITDPLDISGGKLADPGGLFPQLPGLPALPVMPLLTTNYKSSYLFGQKDFTQTFLSKTGDAVGEQDPSMQASPDKKHPSVGYTPPPPPTASGGGGGGSGGGGGTYLGNHPNPPGGPIGVQNPNPPTSPSPPGTTRPPTNPNPPPPGGPGHNPKPQPFAMLPVTLGENDQTSVYSSTPNTALSTMMTAPALSKIQVASPGAINAPTAGSAKAGGGRMVAL